MKKTIVVATLAVFCTILACTKNSETNNINPAGTNSTSEDNNYAGTSGHLARLSSPNYSQSIQVDSANKMLGSYLTSIGYPTVDTTLRALSFDADTLRSYLSNRDIVTVKFMIAHQLPYAKSKFGVQSGLNPNAITLVLVGLDNSDHYVLNSQNGVYDNMGGCPLQCPGSEGGYIH